MTDVQQARTEDAIRIIGMLDEPQREKLLLIGQGMAIAGGKSYEETKPSGSYKSMDTSSTVAS